MTGERLCMVGRRKWGGNRAAMRLLYEGHVGGNASSPKPSVAQAVAPLPRRALQGTRPLVPSLPRLFWSFEHNRSQELSVLLFKGRSVVWGELFNATDTPQQFSFIIVAVFISSPGGETRQHRERQRAQQSGASRPRRERPGERPYRYAVGSRGGRQAPAPLTRVLPSTFPLSCPCTWDALAREAERHQNTEERSQKSGTPFSSRFQHFLFQHFQALSVSVVYGLNDEWLLLCSLLISTFDMVPLHYL